MNVKIGNNCRLIENTLLSNECQLKDQTNIVERGVYQKKLFELRPGGGRVRTKSECSPSVNSAEGSVHFLGTDFAEHLSVKEDSFVKYILSTKNYSGDGDDDDDSEFGSIDDDEPRDYETDDNQSNDSEANLELDTSRNRHFFVWKTITNINKKERQFNHLLRQNEIDSENENFAPNDSTDYSSSESDSSDPDYEHDADYDSDANSNEETKKSSANTQKKHHQLNQDDTEIFFNEVVEILERGLKQNLDSENIVLEINSCKHANNIQVLELFVVK